MSHRTVTPELEISMPRYTHLMRRGSAYYLNMKVPKDLQKPLGKELIRKSLRTTDFHTAKKKVQFEAAKIGALFYAERAKNLRSKPATVRREKLEDWEIQQFVYRFFFALESKSEDWWLSEGRYLDDTEKNDLRYEFLTDAKDAPSGDFTRLDRKPLFAAPTCSNKCDQKISRQNAGGSNCDCRQRRKLESSRAEDTRKLLQQYQRDFRFCGRKKAHSR